MKTEQYFRPISNLAIHPGELLEEELEFISMTQLELAKRMGRPPQVVNEIIKGKKSITHDTAVELENVLGIPAHLWTNAQETYDFTRSRLKERNKWAAQANEGRLKQFPITEIEKRGWIERYRDKADKVGALLAFLGFASLDAWDNHGMEAVTGFRISENSRVSRGALSAWLRRGEIEGRDMETAAYDERGFKRVVKEIRSLTATTPEVFQPRMVDLCADAGVALVFVPELPKSGANGVARWITPDKGLIQMSLKWKWSDIFWFSFFHECYHILRNKGTYVHIKGVDSASEHEKAADEFAANFLISPNEWQKFVDSYCYDSKSVTDLSERIGIDPGIIVGRMQHEKLIPYNRLTNLKKRYQWT